MGKSSSCFKIIACGGDSADADDHAVSESKGSGDKRGWSFRKRSARHRVLSNTAVTETASSANKESPQSVSVNFQSPAESAVPEKISAPKVTDEKPQFSTLLDAKLSENAVDAKLEDEKVSGTVHSLEQEDEKASEAALGAKPVDEKVSETVLDVNPVDAKVSETKVDAEPVDASVSETKLDAKPVDIKVCETVPDANPVDTKVPETVHDGTLVDQNVSEPVLNTENETEDSVDLKESLVIVMQSAIRIALAQKELLKRKNAVKLQAAVRGHLVRQHAVGTLRCVQAIVKMQALVRARQARIAQEESHTEDKYQGKLKKDKRNSKTSVKDNSSTNSNVTYTSIEKLLSNKFARQLLESTPKTKPINIKCDSSKPNSAWKWLERWMSVSSAEPSPEPESVTQQQKAEQELQDNDYYSQINAREQSEVTCEPKEVESDIKDTIASSESEEKYITCNAQSSEIDTDHVSSPLFRDNSVQQELECRSTSNTKEISEVIDSVSNHILELGANSQTEVNSLSNRPELKSDEQPKRSMKRNASEELDTEGKKFVYGSRKASNPAFVAVQSKFEELASSTKSSKSNGSSSQVVGAESNLNTMSSGADTVTYSETKELGMAEISVSHDSTIQVGGSECGTELSVSSTLDSPDRSEVVGLVHESGNKGSEEVVHGTNIDGNREAEDQISSSISVSKILHTVSNQQDNINNMNGESNDPHTASNQQENVDNVNGEPNKSVPAENSQGKEQKLDKSNSDLQRNINSETVHQAYRSSPEASPRSHISVPESQATPSSQTSVKPKKDGSDKTGSGTKRKSLSGGKRSPSNPSSNSGKKGNVEQLSKEQKAGKRRNSFGSTKPDHIEHEPRESGSNRSIPHFMQATESARAKAQANSSPRSSPDVHEREIYVKKRHSLPGASGREGSPRIQRSTSHQAQQGTKGNSSNTQERKWQR